jgi:LacI family transcriptional regulator
MSTLKDVAKEVGVSVATVSYVINGTGSVGDEVRKRVLAAVQKLNYRPNRRAQAMRTGVSQSIGLVLPDLTNPFFPELAQSVENEARKRGMAVVLIDSQNNAEAELQGLAILQQQGVDGIIWCPVDDLVEQKAAKLNCPIVLIDRPVQGFDVVHSNYRLGGAMAAEHAISQGHRRVGILCGPRNIDSAEQRRLGFREKAAGKLDIVWEVEVPYATTLNEPACTALASGDASFVFAANDIIAIGAINSLNDKGIRVPDDISIIGFDDIPWAELIRPKLTTISQPFTDIGRASVDLLLQKIQTPKRITNTIILEVKLVVRDSVATFK